MPRRAVFVVAWLVGGVAAVALATAAVSRVGNQVTGDRPSPLSAEEVAAELALESTTTTGAAPGTETTASTAPETATTDATPTTSPSAPTNTAAPPPPSTAPAGEVRTYALVGGTATLRFAPTGVAVVTANPNPGFKVEVEPSHVNGVEVSFETDRHKSKVEGWWNGGPRDQVEEEADEPDDD